ncbi:Ankyrin Repeat [Seminavis robusta]|uniref:Ankyrin Repeat n=1 Tax=Seminavis robusta TaxID=568900 RepID=A0A9N8H2J5_9STRA|nr:Ankyrin Repeat [Seminavis robusta]|eukprot:Sro10_g007910.1 Ankyrin Repeat (460) ;mRNA; f:45456-47236
MRMIRAMGCNAIILAPTGICSLLLVLVPVSVLSEEVEASIDYGTDVSYPMHYGVLTDLPTERDLLGTRTEKQQLYQENLEGCFEFYGQEEGKASCMYYEQARLDMNLRQPQSMVNYTKNGFVKIRAPEQVWNMVQEFWQQNQHNLELEEEWPTGNIFVNHWKSPVNFVAIDDPTLPGGGNIIKTAIWNAARDTLEQWTGYTMADCSLYGVRIYHENAILAPHVDRLPLVASAILNVAQDVDEPWPLEVIGHDQRAHNITMVPGDLILYESHSIIHGRPFPLKGRFMANVFIHFEPVAPLSEPNPVFTGDLPPYLIPNSPEEPVWRKANPHGWHAVQTAPPADGTTEAHHMTVLQDIQTLRALLDVHPHLANAKDANGWTPLHEAVRTKRGDLVELLVEQGGADIHATTNGGETVLGLAYHFVSTEDPNYQTQPETHPVIQYLENLGATRGSPGKNSQEL